VAKDFVAAFAGFEAAQALCEASDAKATKAGPGAGARGVPALLAHSMTMCVKPLRHLATSGTKSSRSTNQDAPFGRLSTTCC
jgi:hypothetical protein